MVRDDRYVLMKGDSVIGGSKVKDRQIIFFRKIFYSEGLFDYKKIWKIFNDSKVSLVLNFIGVDAISILKEHCIVGYTKKLIFIYLNHFLIQSVFNSRKNVMHHHSEN